MITYIMSNVCQTFPDITHVKSCHLWKVSDLPQKLLQLHLTFKIETWLFFFKSNYYQHASNLGQL